MCTGACLHPLRAGARAQHATRNTVLGLRNTGHKQSTICRHFSPLGDRTSYVRIVIGHLVAYSRRTSQTCSHVSLSRNASIWLLRHIISNPDSVSSWLQLFNWDNTVLHPLRRGGRRHNLSAIIELRIFSYSASYTDSLLNSRKALSRQYWLTSTTVVKTAGSLSLSELGRQSGCSHTRLFECTLGIRAARAASEAGVVPELAISRKIEKYAHTDRGLFEPNRRRNSGCLR